MEYGSFSYGAVELGGQFVPIVVPTPPAGKRFTLFIAGVDRTSLMLANTLQTLNQLSTASTAKLTLWDPTGTFHPVIGQDIQVFSNTFKVFGGYVNESTESSRQANKGVQAYLTCTDYSGILDRRIVGQYFSNFSMSAIVSAIVQTYLSADGFVYNAQDGDPGISLGAQLFQWITVRQVFNQLATATGWEYQVDYNKIIRFFPSTSGLSNAPFNIADNDGHVLAVASKGSVSGATGESATIRTYVGPYTNRVFVTSSSQASPLWSDIFSASNPGPYPNSKQPPGGGRTGFITLYVINQQPVIKINTNAVSPTRIIMLSQVAGAVAGSWDWYWIPNGYGVFQNTANTPLATTDTLEVDYQTQLSPATTAVCGAQVAARAQLEGNTGFYDAVFSAPDITDPTALANFATYLLNRYGCTNGIPNQVIYSTIRDGLLAGMLQTIALTQPLIASHSYLITQVQAYDVDKDHLEYQVTCDYGGYLATTSDQFFAAIINGLAEPQPSNFQTYQWLLAPTIPGVANPGINSNNPASIPMVNVCQHQVEVIQYLSVTCGHGPSNNGPVTVQLIINGTGSLFVNVPKGQTANVELRSNSPGTVLFAGYALTIEIFTNTDATMTDVNVKLVTSVAVT